MPADALLAVFRVEHLLLRFGGKEKGGGGVRNGLLQRLRNGASSFKKKYLDHGLQLDGVGSELADSVGQLLHGHAVLVVLPAESLLVHVDLLQVTGLGCGKQTNQQGSGARHGHNSLQYDGKSVPLWR